MKHIVDNSIFFKPANQAVTLPMGNCKLTLKLDEETLSWDAWEEKQTRNPTLTTNLGNKLLTGGSSEHKYQVFKPDGSGFRSRFSHPHFPPAICSQKTFQSVFQSTSWEELLRADLRSKPHTGRSPMPPGFDVLSDTSAWKAKRDATLINSKAWKFLMQKVIKIPIKLSYL